MLPRLNIPMNRVSCITFSAKDIVVQYENYTEQGLKTIDSSAKHLNLVQIRSLLQNSQKTVKSIKFTGSLGYEKAEPEAVFYAIANHELLFENLERLELVDIANRWLNGVRAIIEKSPVLKEVVLYCQHDFNEILTKDDGILCKLRDDIEKIHLNSVATGKTFELLTRKFSNLKCLKMRCRLFSQDYEAIENFFLNALGLKILHLQEDMATETHGYGKRIRMSISTDTDANGQPGQLMQFLKNCSRQLQALQDLKLSAASSVQAGDVGIVAFNLQNLKLFELSMDMELRKNLSELAEQFSLWSSINTQERGFKIFIITIQRSPSWLFSCSIVPMDWDMIHEHAPLPIVGLSTFEINLNVDLANWGETARFMTHYADAKTTIEWKSLVERNGTLLVVYTSRFSVTLDNDEPTLTWPFKLNPMGNGKGVSFQRPK